jgi:hypothetical protein
MSKRRTEIAYTGETGLEPGLAPRETEFVSLTPDCGQTGS